MRDTCAERPLGARDRLQRVRRRADPDVDPPRRIGAGGLAQPLLLAALVVQAEDRVGNGREALLRDHGTADGARPVGPGFDARQGLVDLGHDVVGVVAERLVDLAVHEVGGVICEMLVAGGGVDLTLPLIIGSEV